MGFATSAVALRICHKCWRNWNISNNKTLTDKLLISICQTHTQILGELHAAPEKPAIACLWKKKQIEYKTVSVGAPMIVSHVDTALILCLGTKILFFSLCSPLLQFCSPFWSLCHSQGHNFYCAASSAGNSMSLSYFLHVKKCSVSGSIAKYFLRLKGTMTCSFLCDLLE